MKLFGKMTLMAMAVTTTASLGFVSPVVGNEFVSSNKSAFAATTQEGTLGTVIKLTGYKSVYNWSEIETFTPSGESAQVSGFKLPKADSAVTITAKNRVGVTQEVKSDGTDNYLVVDTAGVYDVVYSAGADDTNTRKITVEIKASQATLNIADNSSLIIPSVAYEGDKIVFPKAVLLDADGNEMKNGNDVIKVDPVKIVNGSTVKEFDADDGDGYKSYTVKADDAGDFVVTYSYNQAGIKVPSISYTFRIQANKTDISLNYGSFSESLKSFAMEVGVESTLPKPTVINTKANDAEVSNVFTKITVKDMTSGESVDVTDFKYTPMNQGSYRITYVSTDFYGNTCTTSIQRDNVKLTSNSIETKIIGDYSAKTVSEIDIDAEKNIDYTIPSVAYRVASADAEVTIPALFAYSAWGDYDNIKITRSIWIDNSQEVILEETEKSAGVKYTAKDDVLYSFKKAGTYELRYKVQYLDDEGNAISGTTKTLNSYLIEVRDVAVLPTTTNLNVTAPSVTTAVIKAENSTITFDAPAISDDDDKNVQLDVTYKFDNIATEFEAVKNKDGTYSIDVVCPEGKDTEWDSTASMTITFKATNDLNEEVFVTKTVELIDYSSDNTAPVFASVSKPVYDYETKIITLPSVGLSSADATNVVMTCYVSKDGKTIDQFNGQAAKDAVIDSFEYEPTEEGEYVFTYVATDQNYNISTMSMKVSVSFRTGYSVSIDEISTQEYGTKLDLTKLVNVTKAGEAVNFADSKIIIEPIADNDFSKIDQAYLDNLSNETLLIAISGAYEIKPGLSGHIICKEGNISVKAWAKDADGVCGLTNNSSVTVTFESKDTTAPQFKIENEVENNDVIGIYEIATGEDSVEVVLPWFDANSVVENSEEDLTMKVEVFEPGNSSAVFEFSEEDLVEGVCKFEATKEGKYSVKYSLIDANGNSEPRTFTVNVGDVIAPEIVVKDDAITAPKKASDEAQFVIDLEKIDIIETESTLSKKTDLKISVTRNGEAVEYEYSDDDKQVAFKADVEGTYVITFDVKDDAGNEATTITKTFTISSESVTPTNSSTIWGTILIVVSLVVLGLVVFFFVKPSKTKSNKSKKTK